MQLCRELIPSSISPDFLLPCGAPAVVVTNEESRCAQHSGEREDQAPLRKQSEPHITPREKRVLSIVAKGLSNKEVGATLNIAERTVKFHVANLMEKVGVHDRMALSMWYHNFYPPGISTGVHG